MKKIVASIMVLTLVFLLVACKSENGDLSELETSTYLSDEIINIEADDKADETDASIGEDEDTNESADSSNAAVDNDETKNEDSSEPIEDNEPTDDKESTEPSKPVHTHAFVPATCTDPKKCSCGKTEGEALGHKWAEATCTAPKTCSVCKATEGTVLGHDWINATCTAPKTCSACKKTEGAALGHNWEDATCTTPKTCKRCSTTVGNALGHNFESGVCKICKVTDPNYIQYTVSYNANGGWGETESSSHLYNETRALSKNGFKRAGYTFAGWSTDAKATTAQYTDTQSVQNLTKANGDNIILYAVWKESRTSQFDELRLVEDARNNIKFHQSALDNAGNMHNDVAVFKDDGEVSSSSERFTSGLFSKIKGTIIPMSGEYMTEGSKVVIRIYAEGGKIYESEPLNKYSPAQIFEVDIAGVNALKISIVDLNPWTSWNYGGELMIENLTLIR